MQKTSSYEKFMLPPILTPWSHSFDLERAGVHVDMPKMKIESHSQLVITAPENNTCSQTALRTFNNPFVFCFCQHWLFSPNAFYRLDVFIAHTWDWPTGHVHTTMHGGIWESPISVFSWRGWVSENDLVLGESWRGEAGSRHTRRLSLLPDLQAPDTTPSRSSPRAPPGSARAAPARRLPLAPRSPRAPGRLAPPRAGPARAARPPRRPPGGPSSRAALPPPAAAPPAPERRRRGGRGRGCGWGGLRPARNKAAAAILRRGLAPRRQRWPGPTLAQGVRPHLPRNPWRRRALLPRTAGNAAAAPAALNGAFHHNEARRDLRAAARPRRAAIGPGTASRGQAGLQGDAARDRRRCRVKHWRRVPGWASHEAGCAAAMLGLGRRHFAFWRRALLSLELLQNWQWRICYSFTLLHTHTGALVEWPLGAQVPRSARMQS